MKRRFLIVSILLPLCLLGSYIVANETSIYSIYGKHLLPVNLTRHLTFLGNRYPLSVWFSCEELTIEKNIIADCARFSLNNVVINGLIWFSVIFIICEISTKIYTSIRRAT